MLALLSSPVRRWLLGTLLAIWVAMRLPETLHPEYRQPVEVRAIARNMGVALGYALLAYESLLRGLGKLEADPDRLCTDLDANWELLAEPIQTVMRRYGVSNPYEKLKELTRGNRVSREEMQDFILSLEIPQAAKKQLLKLTPWDYTGKAAELARRV